MWGNLNVLKLKMMSNNQVKSSLLFQWTKNAHLAQLCPNPTNPVGRKRKYSKTSQTTKRMIDDSVIDTNANDEEYDVGNGTSFLGFQMGLSTS
jgi:hypothetical protein